VGRHFEPSQSHQKDTTHVTRWKMTGHLFPTTEPEHDQQLSPDEMFARWWVHYPRKVDKGAARTAFKRVVAKKIATFNELMAGVMRYAAERTGEDPQFTKHAATWLNAESWGNEPLVRPPPRLSTANSAALGILAAIEAHDSKRQG
jgi:hypothetical protein